VSQPLFAPRVLAQLPAPFTDQLRGQPDAPSDEATQRAVYRLWQSLQAADDTTIVRFGEATAQAVDALIAEATQVMATPELGEVTRALEELMAMLEAHSPDAPPASSKIPTKNSAQKLWALFSEKPQETSESFARINQRIDAQLARLSQLETTVQHCTQQLHDVAQRRDAHTAALTHHTLACAVAIGLAHPKAARLERRLQVLRTLAMSAVLARQQLVVAEAQLLGLTERTQTLRYATLPLWRQQFMNVPTLPS
jgi:uncharacterized protein YaaN involved in tellurite resistance